MPYIWRLTAFKSVNFFKMSLFYIVLCNIYCKIPLIMSRLAALFAKAIAKRRKICYNTAEVLKNEFK